MEGYNYKGGWFSGFFRGKKRQRGINPDWPLWYQNYARQIQYYEDGTISDEITFTIFDTETTGFDLKKDRLLSIGAVKVKANRLNPNLVFSRFLRPAAANNASNPVAIHGLIPDSDQRSYHGEAAVIRDFLQFVGSDVLVAHHLGFDQGMINQSLKRLGCGKMLNPAVDTAIIARRLSPAGYWSPQDTYTLDLLARRHNIPLSDRHTAVGDSYITAQLFMKLSGKLAARRGRKLMLDDLI
ncbi:DNA polymerase III subunit epsilon [Lewinellaceae bacterium SD302]|nr:DNA polymerase III subunit epsilon [Lewinellaceae bacterium SD302]